MIYMMQHSKYIYLPLLSVLCQFATNLSVKSLETQRNSQTNVKPMRALFFIFSCVFKCFYMSFLGCLSSMFHPGITLVHFLNTSIAEEIF